MPDTVFHLISTSRLDTIESKITGLERALRSLPDRSKPAGDWMTQDEAEDLLDCSRSTLHRYRRDGKLPYSQVGRKIFFRREDVEGLLREHMQAA